MTKNQRPTKIQKQILLENGDFLILTDESTEQDGEKTTYEPRDIYKYKKNGEFIWKIKSRNDWDGNSFTNIIIKNGKFIAYRWDSGVYEVDIDKGIANPLYLAR